jgi:hypothetical protein
MVFGMRYMVFGHLDAKNTQNLLIRVSTCWEINLHNDGDGGKSIASVRRVGQGNGDDESHRQVAVVQHFPEEETLVSTPCKMTPLMTAMVGSP